MSALGGYYGSDYSYTPTAVALCTVLTLLWHNKMWLGHLTSDLSMSSTELSVYGRGGVTLLFVQPRPGVQYAPFQTSTGCISAFGYFNPLYHMERYSNTHRYDLSLSFKLLQLSTLSFTAVTLGL